MKLLYAASEAAPYIKTGGLGDVMRDLPRQAAKLGAEVSLVIPKYTSIPAEYVEKMEYVKHFYVDLGWRRQYCGIMKLEQEGVTVYFIDNEYYFAQGDHIYGELLKDMEKYAFFSKAVLEMLPQIGLVPDIIHVNDWETAMIPVMLNAHYSENVAYNGIKTVIGIHNLKYQGRYDKKTVADLCGLAPQYFTPDKLEYYGDAGFFKGGLVYSDGIIAVSPGYAEEIKTPENGEGLHGLLNARSRELYGILNGVDYEKYSPAKDEIIFEKYNGRTFVKGKRENKAGLLKELGLDENTDKILVGMVGRLTTQKGIEIIESIMDEFLSLDLNFVVLGAGEHKYQDMFRWFESKYHDKMRVVIGFNETLAKKIYAASDVFMMPSVFEPCGISQLIAMKYGTLPLVRETGGLKDTVQPYNEYGNTGNGFSFSSLDGGDMLNAFKYALSIYNDKKKWNSIIRRAMGSDFSWKKSAAQYMEIYKELFGGQG